MDSAPRTPPSRVTLGVLALIVALAALVRVPATTRELPHLPEPDAFLVMHAQERAGDPALVLHQQFSERYPTLLTRTLGLFGPRASTGPMPVGTSEADALDAAAAPYTRARVVLLALSLCALPIVFRLGRRFTSDAGALLATGLVGTSLLHATFSAQARPHAPHVALAWLALWMAVRAAENPTAARVGIAGLAAAAAAASLQSGLFVLPPLALALLLAAGTWRARLARAVLVPLAAAALAFAFYPVFPRIDASGVHLGGQGGHEMLFQQFTWRGLGVAWHWFTGYDPLLAWATALALPVGVVWLVRDLGGLVRGPRVALAVVLAYALPYAALLVVNEEIYDRFLLPLVPACALLVGAAWAAIGSRPLRVVAACAGAVPLAVVARFASVSAAPDTLEAAAEWYRAHVHATEERAVATPYLALPLRHDPSALAALHGDAAAETNPWLRWQVVHPTPGPGVRVLPLPARLAGRRGDEAGVAAWVASIGPRWAVLEVSRKLEGAVGTQHLRAWVAAHGERVYVSDGVAPDALELGLIDYQAVEDMARRLFRTERFGPTVEIWRIVR